MRYYCDSCREWFDEDELDDENQYGDRDCPHCGDDLIDVDLYEEKFASFWVTKKPVSAWERDPCVCLGNSASHLIPTETGIP